MTHTAECESLQKLVTDQREAWQRQWPNYCRRCDGFGSHVFYESHGFTYGPAEQLADQCEECAGKGNCGRCGAPSLGEDASGPCSVCGWHYDDGIPDIVTCYGDCGQDSLEPPF